MSKIKSLEDLINVCRDRWLELADIKHDYLNDKGRGAMDAYRSILWHASFHSNLGSLKDDEDFINLVSIPGKDPEYYKILRMCNRAIEDTLKR